MTRLPRARGREVLAALLRAGFQVSHIRGSHYYLRRPEGTGLVVVPVHGSRDLPVGTVRSVIRQAGLSPEKMTRLLRK